jgi:hypothetical protein
MKKKTYGVFPSADFKCQWETTPIGKVVAVDRAAARAALGRVRPDSDRLSLVSIDSAGLSRETIDKIVNAIELKPKVPDQPLVRITLVVELPRATAKRLSELRERGGMIAKLIERELG